jgi:hypothetical protein
MLECRFQFAEAARSNTVHRNASFSLKRPMHTPQQPTCAKRDGDGRIGLVSMVFFNARSKLPAVFQPDCRFNPAAIG